METITNKSEIFERLAIIQKQLESGKPTRRKLSELEGKVSSLIETLDDIDFPDEGDVLKSELRKAATYGRIDYRYLIEHLLI